MDTAQSAYGFGSWTPAVPGGVAIMPETQVGATGSIPSAALGALPLHWGNPLFWLLLLLLVWTGYLYGAFDIGIRKVIHTGVKVG